MTLVILTGCEKENQLEPSHNLVILTGEDAKNFEVAVKEFIDNIEGNTTEKVYNGENKYLEPWLDMYYKSLDNLAVPGNETEELAAGHTHTIHINDIKRLKSSCPNEPTSGNHITYTYHGNFIHQLSLSHAGVQYAYLGGMTLSAFIGLIPGAAVFGIISAAAWSGLLIEYDLHGSASGMTIWCYDPPFMGQEWIITFDNPDEEADF